MSFTTNSKKFSKFDASDAILFQIQVFGKNAKGVTLASYFTKVTARPSFRQLRGIERINSAH